MQMSEQPALFVSHSLVSVREDDGGMERIHVGEAKGEECV